MKIRGNLFALGVIFLLSYISGIGQDIIVKKSGEEIPCKIVEINPTQIKYKTIDLPESPLLISNKSEIFMIKYGTGLKEVYNVSEPSAVPNASFLQSAPSSRSKIKIEIANGRYYQNDLELSPSNLYHILGKSEDSGVRNLSDLSQKKLTPGKILLTAGIPVAAAGLLLGIIGSAVSQTPNRPTRRYSSVSTSSMSTNNTSGESLEIVGFSLAGLGAASVVAGITLTINGNKNTKDAVVRFNSLIP